MNKTLPLTIFILLVVVFSCKKEKEVVFESTLFNSELLSQIEINNQYSLQKVNFINAINNGTYKPLLSLKEGTKQVKLIEEKLIELPKHGLGNYFNNDLKLIQDHPIQSDSLLLEALKTSNYKSIAELEIKARFAAIEVKKVMEFGLINPNEIFEEGYHIPTKQADSLWNKSQLEFSDYGSLVKNTVPQNPFYNKLQKEFADNYFARKQDDWIKLPNLPASKIEVGDKYKGAQLLRNKLYIAEENDSSKLKNIYDEKLVEAIKKFQSQNGLKQDGIIGASTLKLLNLSPTQIKAQIQSTLERFRWNTDVSYKNLFLVNIPEYQFYLFENDQLIKKKKVCVGINADELRTPEFIDTLEKVVVNPKWYIPYSIATKEILPKAQADPNYLIANNYQMYQGSVEVLPFTVDLLQFNESNFPYRFEQGVGGGNALGKIKFLFPNKFSIYLHDTPSKYVFNRDKRSVSHGCIRLENPFELGDYLFKNNKDYLTAKKGEETEILYPEEEKFQVYITYFTTWVNDDNQLQFRPDVYKRDQILSDFLKKKGIIE